MRDITDPRFEICGYGKPVTARKTWKCNFCGYVIRPLDDYYWVRRKGNFTGTLRACANCFERKINALQKEVKEDC